MSTEITILPEEIRPLAEQVEESKKNEITASIQAVFQDQSNLLTAIENVKITSIDQVEKIKYAKEIRLEAKRKRLEVEKVLDLKRAEVQHKMAGFKTEDALYLKTKQMIQIKYKHIEELAEYQEKFIERHEAEQKELKFQLRTSKLEKFQVDLTFINLREMSDSDFDLYFQNQQQQHEAKLEAERIQKFNAELKAKLETQEKKLERIAQEKQAEEDRKKLEAERIEKEKQIELERIEAAKKLEEEKAKAEEQRKLAEAQRIENERRENELRAANEKLQAEQRAKEIELEKAKQEAARLEAEKQKQIKADEMEAERIAKLDDKGKLQEFLNQLELIDYPICKSSANNKIIEAAKDRITKICEFLKSEIK